MVARKCLSRLDSSCKSHTPFIALSHKMSEPLLLEPNRSQFPSINLVGQRLNQARPSVLLVGRMRNAGPCSEDHIKRWM